QPPRSQRVASRSAGDRCSGSCATAPGCPRGPWKVGEQTQALTTTIVNMLRIVVVEISIVKGKKEFRRCGAHRYFAGWAAAGLLAPLPAPLRPGGPPVPRPLQDAGGRGGRVPGQLRALHRAQPAGGGAWRPSRGSTAGGMSLTALVTQPACEEPGLQQG